MRFSAIPDAERNKTIQTGCPIFLRCELSDPSAQVHWYKDGSKLHPQSGLDILSEGVERNLIIHSAEFFHSGLYCCKTKGDTITFSVDIKGDVFYLKQCEKLTSSSPAKQLTLTTFLCVAFLLALLQQLSCCLFFDRIAAC